jgi:serine/threonine protein kinase
MKTDTLYATLEYLAPVIILNKEHSKLADWWTLGILLYELFAGINPFNDDDRKGKINLQRLLKSNMLIIIEIQSH